jgi:proteasome lid subunit RPN8/RPN11
VSPLACATLCWRSCSLWLPRIMLGPHVVDLLSRAIRNAGAREICGFLLSSPDGEQQLRLVSNWASMPGSFIVGESEVQRIERCAERERLQIQAFVHSHSSVLELSEEDNRGIRSSDLPWILVKLDGDQLTYAVYELDGEPSTILRVSGPSGSGSLSGG